MDLRRGKERERRREDEDDYRALIVDRSKAVIICPATAEPRCNFSSSRCIFCIAERASTRRDPEERERNSIWAILDILIRLGNVRCIHDKISRRCQYQMSKLSTIFWMIPVAMRRPPGPRHVSLYPSVFRCSQPIPSRFFRPRFR